MKRFLVAFLILLLALPAQSAHIVFNLQDFVQDVLAVKQVKMTPTTMPDVNGSSIVTRDTKTKQTSTAGSVTFSNVVEGAYRVDVTGPTLLTTFNITVTNTSDTLNASDLISVSTNSPAGEVGYSQASADGRFLRQIIYTNGTAASTQSFLNFVYGTNMAIRTTNNATTGRTDVYISSSASGGGAGDVTGGNANQFSEDSGVLTIKSSALVTNVVSRSLTNHFGTSAGINVTNQAPVWISSTDSESHHMWWIDQFNRQIFDLRRDVLNPRTNSVIYLGGQNGQFGAITLNTFWRQEDDATNHESRITFGFTDAAGSSQFAVFRARPGVFEGSHDDFVSDAASLFSLTNAFGRVTVADPAYATHIRGNSVTVESNFVGLAGESWMRKEVSWTPGDTNTYYTNTIHDRFVYLTASPTNLARTNLLIDATARTNALVTIKDAVGHAAGTNIVIATRNSQTIDGAASYTIARDYGSVTLQVRGTNWAVVHDGNITAGNANQFTESSGVLNLKSGALVTNLSAYAITNNGILTNAGAVYNGSHLTTHGAVTNNGTVRNSSPVTFADQSYFLDSAGFSSVARFTNGLLSFDSLSNASWATVSGAVTNRSIVTNAGAVYNGSHLTTHGAVTNNSTTRMAGNVTAAGDLSVSGAVQVDGATTLSGTVAINDPLTATDTADFQGTIKLPNGAAPTTDTFGQIAADNNAWASGRGALQIYDGTANTYAVAVLASDTPGNGQVPKWNTGGTITWEDDSTGGSGSAVYLAAVHTNITLANTSTNQPVGASPTDGTPFVYQVWRSWTNHMGHSVFEILETDNWNSSGVKSNRVTKIGKNIQGSPNYVPTNASIWMDFEGDFNTTGNIDAGQAEFHLNARGTNGNAVRVIAVDVTKGGSVSGPYLVNGFVAQNQARDTNYWEVRTQGANAGSHIAYGMLQFDGVPHQNNGRSKITMNDRGSVKWANSDESLVYAISVDPDQKSLSFLGDQSGATNFIFTNFTSARVVVQIPRGGLEIGPGSTTVTNTLAASASLDFPDTAAQTHSDLGITVTGTTTNDFAQLAVPWQVQMDGASYSCFSSNDTVWVRFVNASSSSKNPAAGTFRALVTKVR